MVWVPWEFLLWNNISFLVFPHSFIFATVMCYFVFISRMDKVWFLEDPFPHPPSPSLLQPEALSTL
jgi:hypothetical protein